LRLQPVGPARYAAHGQEEGSWLAGFGPIKKRKAGWAKEGGEKAFGPKAEKEEDFYFLFFF
jgi:hypothetical protein